MSSVDLKAKSRLWIIGQNGTFLGEGRIALLHAIKKHGSISKAAISMNMSYLKAWKLVKSMNIESEQPLVIKISGGKGGGGTTLTEEGMKAIALYESLNIKCKLFLDQELKNYLRKRND